MGFGLFDYAEQNPDIQEPQQEASAIRETSQTYRERQERQQDVETMKKSIMQQLEQGNAPHLILYTAIRAIGTASVDEAWTEAAVGYLDKVYGDLMQESFLQDNAAVAAKRLEEQRAEYLEKLKKAIARDQRQVGKLSIALQEAQDALDALDPPDIRNLELPPLHE